MNQGYMISKSLVERLTWNELKQLGEQACVDLGWWTLPYGRSRAYLLSLYADGFYRSTCDLLNQFVEKTLYSDAEVLPILFLFSHFVELALKASIEFKLLWLKAARKPKELPYLKHHNLSDLLQTLAGLFGPGEPFLSEGTQAFIQKIDNLNERAQAFRYPFDKKERELFWEDRPLLSMRIFQAEVEIHGAELNGFHQWLADPDEQAKVAATMKIER